VYFALVGKFGKYKIVFIGLSGLIELFVCVEGLEGAFKKLKPDPGVSLGGGSLSSVSAIHSGHTPTTSSCPTPARRRHRTTFTQVTLKMSFTP